MFVAITINTLSSTLVCGFQHYGDLFKVFMLVLSFKLLYCLVLSKDNPLLNSSKDVDEDGFRCSLFLYSFFCSRRCHNVFLNQLQLGSNIACNKALRETIFMMVVCIDTRIPLFLVGKPSNSKSLVKSVVASAMQGDSSRSPLFRCLKQVRLGH